MENEKIFEFATRNKVRFPYRGVISVEDLWDLSVENLDSIFKALNRQVKQTQEESLLEIKTKEDKLLEIQIAIVKHIVEVKVEEEEKRQKARERKEQKQKIMSIMASKQDEALQNKSLDELKKMLNELDD